ncbi:MAG: translation initiation factor IF-6 [Thermoplasmata archaeon]|nr:translation initiation factor IF-6 [Thermoplasmata archaeon]
MLRLGDVNGNPYVGVFCAASENLAIVPETIEKSITRSIEEVLHVEVVCTNIAGSILVGSLLAMNSNGVVATNLAELKELKKLPNGLNVVHMQEKINAAGNNLLVNDNGACVHPATTKKALERIQDALGVEVQKRTIGGIETVGSAGICTGKGLVCHPNTSEDELRELSELFKVPAVLGTLNYGTPFVGACAVANSKGAFVGSRTTPIEMGRLEDGLYLF